MPRKDVRLLLVDDNAINQKVALLMLKKIGYTADVVKNGLEAVKAAAENRYDVILMDCLMPEMDGYEATRLIRLGDSPCAEVPIIAMTANAFAEDREACLAAGMSDYLAKPVRDGQLRAKLEHWLARSADDGAGSKRLLIDEERFASSVWALDAQLAELVESGQGDLVGELLRVFLIDTDKQILSAETALAAEDFDSIHFSAHSLKGASAAVGATVMADGAARLETAARRKDARQVRENLARLSSYFGGIRSAIESSLVPLATGCGRGEPQSPPAC